MIMLHDTQVRGLGSLGVIGQLAPTLRHLEQGRPVLCPVGLRCDQHALGRHVVISLNPFHF